MADTQRMTTAPESYVEWEKRTRTDPSRALWRSPTEIAQVLFVTVFCVVNTLGFPALPLIFVGVFIRVVTPHLIERGLPMSRALVMSAVGTIALVAAVLVSLSWFTGYAFAALIVVSDWQVGPSVLRWIWAKRRRN
jgi:hypothetical protein